MGQRCRRVSAFAGGLSAAALLAAPAQPRPPVRMLLVGDSIPAALDYQPALERTLSRGLDLRYDLRVCRRLATTGCPYDGSVPDSALDAVRAAGTGIGPVLLVDVGYNDDPDTYGPQMVEVINAAKALGVRQIVWVTLRETQEFESRINTIIRIEAGRHPIVQVADWNAASAGKPWFRPDGLHLNDAGARGLAAFLRGYILRAATTAS
jgi:hypothetical protein